MSDKKRLKKSQKNLQNVIKNQKNAEKEKNMKAIRKIIQVLYQAENSLMEVEDVSSFSINIPFIGSITQENENPVTNEGVELLIEVYTPEEVDALDESETMAIFPIKDVFATFEEVKTYLGKNNIERVKILLGFHCALVELLEKC